MGGLRVDPVELDILAKQRHGAQWPTVDAQVHKLDSLPNTQAAVENLNANARTLTEYQNMARLQNQKLEEMLTITAGAYRRVDTEYAGKIDDGSRERAVDAISVPAPSTQVPPVPDFPPFAPISSGGYSDVEQTQRALLDGDHGASLQTAAAQWTAAANAARGNAANRQTTNWEGDAADAAMHQLNRYSEWLGELAAAWDKLAAAAERVLAAHAATVANHTGVYTRYMIRKAQLAELAAHPTGQGMAMAEIQRELKQLQEQSDDLREDYASHSTFTPAQPSEPEFAGQLTSGQGTGGSSGTGGGGQQGGSPAGGPPAGGQPAMSPQAMSAQNGPGSGLPQGGSPSGKGSPSGGGGAPAGGGAPSGGGKPGGGLPGGGLPGGAGIPETGLPELPLDDPGVSPAGVGGGGSGGGSGGGGGVPPMPLQPNVGAETVAPGPAGGGARGGGSGAIPASAMGGMGGAMGGMGGMGHGGAQQNQEKRRDPRLAADEEIYVEDRAYTEPVIGNRRRRDVQDKEPK